MFHSAVSSHHFWPSRPQYGGGNGGGYGHGGFGNYGGHSTHAVILVSGLNNQITSALCTVVGGECLTLGSCFNYYTRPVFCNTTFLCCGSHFLNNRFRRQGHNSGGYGHGQGYAGGGGGGGGGGGYGGWK